MRVRDVLLLLAFGLATAAHADITIGVTLSETGPAASIGIPERRTVELMPDTIAGVRINYVKLDDASDSTAAVKNAKKLIAENNIDVLLGSSTSPGSIALVDVVGAAGVPLISVSASRLIVHPVEGNRRWTFKTTQNDAQMAAAVVTHMVANGVKSVAVISQNDAYGQGWSNELKEKAEARGLKVVSTETFVRTDSSVTAQVLKTLAARPDAVLIAAAGTPSALPHIDLVTKGYKGKIYQSHGAANADFLRVGGKAVEGAFLAVGPMLVAEQLPDSAPTKAPALAFLKAYESKYGNETRSTFAGHAWDAWQLLQRALPVALKKASPGTAEFRTALRDALEQTKDAVGTHGVFNMSSTDHTGLDERAAVVVTIQNGNWVLVK